MQQTIMVSYSHSNVTKYQQSGGQEIDSQTCNGADSHAEPGLCAGQVPRCNGDRERPIVQQGAKHHKNNVPRPLRVRCRMFNLESVTPVHPPGSTGGSKE